MRKKLLYAILTLFLFRLNANSQEIFFRATNPDHFIVSTGQLSNQGMDEMGKKIDTWIKSHLNYHSRSITTIPVVVHVVWNDSTQNVSDAQIQSQIDVLNKDFRKLNADTLLSAHPFAQFAGDAQIEFCLAQRDPNGNPTTGITRTHTIVTVFDYNNNLDSVWYTSSGGHDNWDPNKYLNIWVCNIGGGYLGDTHFPSALLTHPEQDGLRIHYTAFGAMGTAQTPYDKGRDVTQLTGSWLGLYHLWGQGNCGDDSVADTPPSETYNLDCPTFPHNANSTCGAGQNGEMFMNFMDWVNDTCMVMYTNGQIARMQATLNTLRSSLLTSQGCLAPSGINEMNANNSFRIFPDPGNGTFSISSSYFRKATIEVYNMLDQKIYEGEFSSLTGDSSAPITLHADAGIYFVRMREGEKRGVQRLIVQ